MGMFDFWEKGWDDISGNTARRQQEKAMRTTQSNNAAALAAEQEAQQKALDFQKILAYFQLQQANLTGQQNNMMAAQQLAGTLAGQQQAANQFAQLYNQDLTNNLPQMQARLAALQALGPLMQMSGLQAYQMPTSLDTTKLTAPDIIGQFDTLSSKYAQQYNPTSLQQAQQQQGNQFLQAMSDPAAWLASQGTAGTVPAHAPAPSTTTPTSVAPSQRTGNLFSGVPSTVLGSAKVTPVVTATYHAGAGQPPVGNPTATPIGQGGTFGASDAAWLQQHNPASVTSPIPVTQAGALNEFEKLARIKQQQEQEASLNVAAKAATPVYNPATAQPTMTNLQAVSGPLQGSQLETDPVYQFRLQQAQRELANQLSRRGLGTGGVATQANTNLALGMARDESNEKYNRLMNLVNMGMGGGMTQVGTNAGQQLGSMYQQGATATGNALSNVANAQNAAAQNRSGIYSGLANAYGQNAAARGQTLANYYGANSAAAQQYGNWQAQQPSGLSRVIDLGTKIYGASQGFNSGSQSSPFGYFGTKGSWSNPYSDYELANTPVF